MRTLSALLLIVLLLTGCSKGSKAPVTISPGKASLVFPEENSLCTAGTIVSTTESTIDFKWNSASNTDSYTLTYKNLLTGVTTTKETSAIELSVTLARSTPYSWYITSASSKGGSPAQSDTWKFYNSGPGEVSHVPFPAQLVSPGLGATVSATSGTITLTWTGSDVDNDITAYDVYIDTTATPALYKSDVTASTLSGIPVTANTTYYWMIVTKDSKGNTSNSNVYQFTAD